MITLADRIDVTGGRPSGFDYLRLGLAVAILAIHSVLAAYGPDGYKAAEGWLVHLYVEPALVPCFFALSGFLVAGSLERSPTLITFLGLRALRIFPALAMETLLSAFIIGAAFTRLPLATYFSSPLFWSYLGNIVGIVQFALPGAFAANPDPNIVNGQLWTVPYELDCYISLTVIALLGKRMLRLSTATILSGMILIYLALRGGAGTLPAHYDLIVYFLLGVALFLHRALVPWNRYLAVMGGVLFIIANTRYSFWMPLGWIGLAYATVFIGLCNPYKLTALRGADYSYGIYLYHYAVLQSVTAVVGGSALVIFMIGLPLTISFAALSWHLIELRALSLRRHLPAIEFAILGKRPCSRPDAVDVRPGKAG